MITGPGPRVAPRVVGGVLLVVGAVAMLGVGFVRHAVLDEATYERALVNSRAYQRVYTEVLPDPAFTVLHEQLLGRLTPAASNAEVRSLSTSALRWTVPPGRLREATEYVIEQVLAYVRGETPRLVGTVNVVDIIDRVPDTAVAFVRALLADATESVAQTLGRYDAEVQVFARELAAGRIPDAVPVYGGTHVDADQLAAVIRDVFGDRLDDRVQAQVEAAIHADDERGALIAAASSIVAEYAQSASQQLRDETVAARDLDIVAAIATRAGVAPQRVVDEFNAMRSLARWADWPTVVVGGALVAVGAALVASGSTDGRRVRITLALLISVSGVAFWSMWVVATRAVGSPLGPAVAPSDRGWGLPGALRRLLADIDADVSDQFRRGSLGLALVVATTGLVLATGDELVARRRAFTPRRVALAASAAAAIALVGWTATIGPASVADEPECNGRVELCERRYDEVVYAASHNAMSSPDVVYLWPEQDHDLRTQLNHGVRALLLDTHYWRAMLSEQQLGALNPMLTPDLAELLFDRLDRLRDARDGTYLCHAHCALGAIALADGLREIRAFLDENPREVVTLIIQDAVSADDTAAAFAEAGLDEYLHAQPAGEPWPTLGDMVESGRRLVVFAEFGGPPPDWYQHASDWIQDTPFGFRSSSQFACLPNRGVPEATLLLVNHWIHRAAPDRADAATVNRLDVIVERAHLCENTRGMMPNFVAVNFTNVGDVVAAADALNAELIESDGDADQAEGDEGVGPFRAPAVGVLDGPTGRRGRTAAGARHHGPH